MPEIRVGGATLRLPDGASEDAIQAAIVDFRSSPEFDEIVDKQRGAPARVRMLVGSSTSPDDRLANIQRFYPDAVPYGDGNFVFTDPESGNPTLYNPEGLDFGDVASVGREASQFVGGGFGAVMGTAGGPLGTAVGAGAGAAAGGAVFDATMNLTQGRIDTRGPLGTILDTAIDFGANAIGQRFGEMLGLGIKKMIGGGSAQASRIMESFRRLRIDPPAGAASGSRAVGSVETMLRNAPTSATVMQEQAEQTLKALSSAADDLASRFGPARTTQGAGAAIKEAAQGVAERFGARQSAIYDQAFDMIGETTPAPVQSAQRLLKEMGGELARAPNALQRAMSPAIRQLQQIVDDAGQDGVEFGALRQIRTMIGRQMDEPILAEGGSNVQQGLRRIYGALTEDLSQAARTAGPDAARRLTAADRYTRAFMTTAQKTMAKINKFDADEKAFRFAMASSQDGGTALSRMRRHFLPEEWDVVAGTVLKRLGLARAGAQDAGQETFSVSTFMTNWSRLAPEARAALFGGKRYQGLAQGLDDLVEAASSLKGMERLANTSNTGHVLIGYVTLSTTMGALGALATGDTTGAISGIATGLVGPRVAARLITSPRFVNWLTTPVTSAGAVSAHLGRLTAIAEAEPRIREEIYQYMQALRGVTAADEQPIESAPAEGRTP